LAAPRRVDVVGGERTQTNAEGERPNGSGENLPLKTV